MKSNLSEGLSRNALEHLVLPVLSIDEYESKISDKRAVVIGFFVQDEAPAKDLSHFIDRSSLPILDTEVSPSPTEEGFYITWVELRRSQDLPKVIIDMLNEIENLCNISQWQFTCPRQQSPLDLDEKQLKEHLMLDPNDVAEIPSEQQPVSESVDFWRHAAVKSFSVCNDVVNIDTGIQCLKFQMVQPNSHTALITENMQAMRIQAILGPSYAVYATTDGFLIECGDRQEFVQTLT